MGETGKLRREAMISNENLTITIALARVVVDGGWVEGGGVGPSFALLDEVGVRSHRTVWKRSRGSHCILLRSWRQSRRQVKICLLQGLGWVVGGAVC